ncbi:MAG: type II secretion system protein [Epsilonproteobacteria bacterium]|nr:type II secretion system protein [Campylobacterota bacterium]
MKKGFTLVELLVTFLILGFLVSMVAPWGSKMYEKFQKKLQQHQLNSLVKKSIYKAVLEDREIEIKLKDKIIFINPKGFVSEKKLDSR